MDSSSFRSKGTRRFAGGPLLPQLTPATDLGAVFAAAYAARSGGPAGGPGPAVTPAGIGRAVTELVSGPRPDQDAYLLTGAGLRPL